MFPLLLYALDPFVRPVRVGGRMDSTKRRPQGYRAKKRRIAKLRRQAQQRNRKLPRT